MPVYLNAGHDRQLDPGAVNRRLNLRECDAAYELEIIDEITVIIHLHPVIIDKFFAHSRLQPGFISIPFPRRML